jgi:hypothetical protein
MLNTDLLGQTVSVIKTDDGVSARPHARPINGKVISDGRKIRIRDLAGDVWEFGYGNSADGGESLEALGYLLREVF